jgi:2-iminobutanoate/2-iminopropanoate deaminase
MARDALFPDGLARPKAPYSPVVRSGAHVYTAGQVGFDASGSLVEGGTAEQTRQTLANLAACLRAAGCTLDDVVKVNVFLLDLADFDAFNGVYRDAFAEPFPARTTVQAGLPGGIRVEIEAVARDPGTDS